MSTVLKDTKMKTPGPIRKAGAVHMAICSLLWLPLKKHDALIAAEHLTLDTRVYYPLTPKHVNTKPFEVPFLEF